jgi:cell division septum initiation protein DivIVA
MQSDVSFERRLRYQDMAIRRLMCEVRLLRDENADLSAQLEAARSQVNSSSSNASSAPVSARNSRPAPNAAASGVTP